MRPATKRTFDLLPSASPGQSFCTDRKNLHCHFSYGPIIAEPRLDFGFCGSVVSENIRHMPLWNSISVHHGRLQVNLAARLIKHHAMKTCGEVGI
jgi:hypothetical protein